MVDVATRYPDAMVLRNIGTQTVTEALLKFSRYGIPSEKLSDQDSNFTSDLMNEVNRFLSIKQLLTTPYHPMANGMVERFNGTMKQMLKKMCQERSQDWDRHLPDILFAYREVPQASLGVSPFEMLYGRNVRGSLTILKEVWLDESISTDMRSCYSHVLKLREKLERTCELAHRTLREAKLEHKKYYDKGSCKRQLQPGQKAPILLPSDHNKLVMFWKGPFDVTQKCNNVDYELRIGDKNKVLRINMLKRYEEWLANQEHGLTRV